MACANSSSKCFKVTTVIVLPKICSWTFSTMSCVVVSNSNAHLLNIYKATKINVAKTILEFIVGEIKK